MDYIKKLPGFRSGSRKRMAIATAGYLLIALTVIGLFVDSESDESVDASMAELPTATATEALPPTATEATLTPIDGWSSGVLLDVASGLNLRCDGPDDIQLLGDTYLAWSCEGAVAGEPASSIFLDITGLDADRVLSASLQINTTPQIVDAKNEKRLIVDPLLSALTTTISTPARDWFETLLADQSTDRTIIEDVTFDVYLHTDQSLSLDISASGF